MNVDYLNAYTSATLNVIETMAQVPVRVTNLRLNEKKTTYGEVTGIVGMSSKTLKGTLVISFSESSILGIVAAMTLEPEKTEIDNEVVDAVGELTNMICGGVKTRLTKLNRQFNLALPTTIVGRGVQICYPKNTPVVVIPFVSPNGDFVVEANLSSRN